MKPHIADALFALTPNASFQVHGEAYEDIVWLDETTSCPAKEAVLGQLALLEAEYQATEYQRKRSLEYPPITDYIDGVVKGDQAQIDKYIADCLAVKAKYPKP